MPRERPRADRRTRAALLAAVAAEVERMQEDRVEGPAALLAERLAARGVRVTEATLRSGDCRPLLERVWRRRPRSVCRYGPTGGHDLRPVVELVDHVIDLRHRIGRVRADLRGEIHDRSVEVVRDPRSLAACARQAARLGATAALVERAIKTLAARGVTPTFASVAEKLTEDGNPICARSIRREEAYWRPILRFHDVEPPAKPCDPERKSLERKSSEELGAMVYALLAELRSLEAEFAETLG